MQATAKEREMCEDVKRRGRNARERRIDRLREEFRELTRRNQLIFDRWRAEGILPPEEPRRRV